MTDLDLLFSTDPRTLTDSQLRELISEEQRRRSVFHSEEAAKAAKPPKERAVRVTPTTLAKPVADISLDDL